MNSPLGRKVSPCDRFQEWLEESSVSSSSATPGGAPETTEIFIASAPAELREHALVCGDCRDAAEDIVTVRSLLREMDSAPVAKPWFAPRVMATIASQEAELSRVAGFWLAVPRFASRLSWVAAVLLLFTCTWLYEKPVRRGAPQTAAAFASEHLFDPPAVPASHDDVLISLNEKDQ